MGVYTVPAIALELLATTRGRADLRASVSWLCVHLDRRMIITDGIGYQASWTNVCALNVVFQFVQYVVALPNGKSIH
jgi:hypothetical protein